jgi:hypothetical protein
MGGPRWSGPGTLTIVLENGATLTFDVSRFRELPGPTFEWCDAEGCATNFHGQAVAWSFKREESS